LSGRRSSLSRNRLDPGVSPRQRPGLKEPGPAGGPDDGKWLLQTTWPDFVQVVPAGNPVRLRRFLRKKIRPGVEALSVFKPDIDTTPDEKALLGVVGIELLILVEILQLPIQVPKLVELALDLLAGQLRRNCAWVLSQIVESPRDSALAQKASGSPQ